MSGIRGKGLTVTIVSWFLVALCVPFVLMRLYTRHYLRGGLKADDYIIILNWLLLLLFIIFVTLACRWGMGQHTSELSEDQISKAILFILCDQVPASLLVGLGKVAVAVFLLQIVVQRWHKWFLWICIVTVSILSVFTCITAFTQCTPAESIWNPRLADQKQCWVNFTTVAFVVCSYAAFLDFLLAIFPWIALRRLRMKKKERIVICSSLSLGIVAGICGVFRTAGLGALYNFSDYTHAIANTTIWTGAEFSATIICVSLPVTRPLWLKLRNHRRSRRGNFSDSPNPEIGAPPTIGSSPIEPHRGTLQSESRDTGDSREKSANDNDENALVTV